MDITFDKYKTTCLINQPCDCNAPIAYTCILPEYNDEVGTELFTINLRSGVSESIYSNIPKGADQDDLGLRCTKCGTDWTSFNPLFM